MEHQDWKEVVIRKKHNSKTSVGSGIPTGSIRKGGGANKNQGRKYKEDEFGMPITKGLPKGFGRRMQQARSAKGWTQKGLASKIGERIQIVKDYESERVPNVNSSIVQKLEKHLSKL